VIVPRPGASDDFPDESAFRGRFFLTVIENHLKAIDTETYRLFDLLSEASFDQEAMNAMGMTRSIKDRSNKLLMLCHQNAKSYIQRIDFN